MKKNEKPPISSRLSGAAIPALFHSRIINLPIEFDMEDCKGTPFKSFGVRVYDNSGDTPCRFLFLLIGTTMFLESQSKLWGSALVRPISSFRFRLTLLYLTL